MQNVIEEEEPSTNELPGGGGDRARNQSSSVDSLEQMKVRGQALLMLK